MVPDEGMHHIGGKVNGELLFPGRLWVNSNISLRAQFLVENLKSFDANVRSLAINGLFFTSYADI